MTGSTTTTVTVIRMDVAVAACARIAAMADASYKTSLNLIERYQLAVQSKAHEILGRTDRALNTPAPSGRRPGKAAAAKLCTKANEEMADMLRKETDDTLKKVLNACSNAMKNQYARSDA